MKHLNTILLLIFLSAISMNGFAEADSPSAEQTLDISSLPVVNPYFFQHQYLSVIAPQIEESDTLLLATATPLNSDFTIMNGFRSPFKDSDITIKEFKVSDKTIYVWRFPESQYLREALYMTFVPKDGHYIAYAISIGLYVDWELSTSTESSRQVFGRIKKPESAKECLDLMLERGILKEDITRSELFQEGYTGPDYRK